MKPTVIMLLVSAITSAVALPCASALFVQDRHKEVGALRERDEIRQSHRLAPGTRVEVSSIRGSVEIETADIEVAEIHIVRSAQSRDALEQYKVGIENKPQSLIIRGEQRLRNSASGSGPEVRHHVMLRLPRAVNLSVSSISGGVRIGDIAGQLSVNSVSGSLTAGAVDGQAQINSVSDSVTLGQVTQSVEIKSVSGNVALGQSVGALDVSGVSGSLSAGVSNLGARGVRISSVSGQVELRFRDQLNAQLSADNVSGKVSIEVPNVTMQSAPGSSAVRALIGTGGHPISINGVSRDVRLTQGR
jgi:hypothetical protein